MSIKKRNFEAGQVLVILVFAVIGLLGFAALAIDGGMVYSDRRNAQNAADAAALAGAYEIAHNPSSNPLSAAAARATANGFTDGDGLHTVEAFYPPESGTYLGNTEYVQVKISSRVVTSLIHFVYDGPVVNNVESVAHFLPAVEAPLYDGNGLVSLSPHDCGSISLGGNSQTTVLVGGIFVNSDITGGSGCHGSNDYAIIGNGAFDVSTPSLSSVGAVDPVFIDPSNPRVDILAVHQPAPAFNYPPGISLVPPPDCSAAPTVNYVSATQTYSPTVTGGLAKIPVGGIKNNHDPSPSKPTLTFESGVYCVDSGDFSFSGDVAIDATRGVMFFVTGSNPCDWAWTGSGIKEPTLNIYGPDTSRAGSCTPGTVACGFKKIVIYIDPKGFAPGTYPMSHEIGLAGNSGSLIDGTIYAPTCHVKYVGTHGFSVLGQVIGYDFSNAGTNSLNITYDANDAGSGVTDAYVDLSK